MENQDTVKILAKSRVKLAAVATLMLILAGVAAECIRHGQPLDEAVVVMLKQEATNVAAAEKTEPAKPAAEVLNTEERRRESEGAAEFIRYMQEIHERAGAVAKPESALSKIIPQQLQQAAPLPEVPVNEQVIEVYDESGEVVEIVEVRGETTAEPQEVSAEVSAEPDAAVVSGQESEPVANGQESEPVANGQESEPVVENVSAPETEAAPEATPVLETESVPAPETEPAPEATPAESAQSENVAPEPVVNAEENNPEIIETEADAPAIDMMKDIIAREQAAAGENNISN